jgi:hypothetical protein
LEFFDEKHRKAEKEIEKYKEEHNQIQNTIKVNNIKMGEINEILQKLGTQLSEAEKDEDKNKLQKEITELKSEVSKISTTSEKLARRIGVLESGIKKQESIKSQSKSASPEEQQGRIREWIKANQTASKPKNVKIMYIESDSTYRTSINDEINNTGKFCLRGYSDLENLEENLKIEMPHLILLNRVYIEEDEINAIKKFINSCEYPCYCITYSLKDTETAEIETLKTDIPFAVHAPGKVSINLLQVLTKKISAFLDTRDDKSPKIYLNKKSPNSRIALHMKGFIHELGNVGVGLLLPATFHNSGGCQLESRGLQKAGLGKQSYFKCIFQKPNENGNHYHRLIFVGLTAKQREKIQFALSQIEDMGIDNWNSGSILEEDS